MILAISVLLVQGMISAVLLRNRLQFKSIHSQIRSIDPPNNPLVSILIPARNEEDVIKNVVISALKQSYQAIEVIVLDDNSNDNTSSILAQLALNYGLKLRVYQGSDRPDGWLGKPWACFQLSTYASGDIFLFVDADTQLEETLVDSIIGDFENNGDGLVTVWPQQILGSFSEKVIIPLVYYTLVSFLFTDYTRRDPKWMPSHLALMFRNLFAAACGQCIAIPKTIYEHIGGHHLVKSDVVEDVAFARSVRNMGLPVRMYHGLDSIQCRMYTNHNQIFMGFRKNFLAGFGNNLALFIASALLHIMVFILPLILFPVSVLNNDWMGSILWMIAIVIPIGHRLLLNKWFKWPAWTAFTHVFGVLWFQYLGLVVLFDRLFNRKVLWKGRPLS